MASLELADAPAPGSDQLDPTYLMDHPDSTEEIPILDISSYREGAPGARPEGARGNYRRREVRRKRGEGDPGDAAAHL